jgi:hypothetical protein
VTVVRAYALLVRMKLLAVIALVLVVALIVTALVVIMADCLRVVKFVV